jgi:molybdopterin-guanine dinucleotide biosynthesis protein
VASAPPLISIVGWKNSGKMTLIERLVAALTRRG